jgi:hypothetical protein
MKAARSPGFKAKCRLLAAFISASPRGQLAIESRSSGLEIGDWPVRRGLAVDYPYFSNGKYDSAQDAASKAHAGIWGLAAAENWEGPIRQSLRFASRRSGIVGRLLQSGQEERPSH